MKKIDGDKLAMFCEEFLKTDIAAIATTDNAFNVQLQIQLIHFIEQVWNDGYDSGSADYEDTDIYFVPDAV